MRKYNDNGDLGSFCSYQAKFFQVFRVQDGWMALAKEAPFDGVNDPVNEEGELWYAFGDSADDALARLKLELQLEGVEYAEAAA